MALTAVFEVPGMTQAHYDHVMKDLADAGEAAPTGRLSHVASPSADGWFVVDVWESESDFGRFANVLMPMLGGLGIQPPQPRILPTHGFITAT